MLQHYTSLIELFQKDMDELQSLCNAFPIQKWILNDRFVAVVRPFVASNLYDRLSTRPFLSNYEKKWIVYQLLVSLAKAHSKNVRKGIHFYSDLSR
jgi:phosphoinositide-3-kinase regulatory subunit 4